jgi:hypothetical protein
MEGRCYIFARPAVSSEVPVAGLSVSVLESGWIGEQPESRSRSENTVSKNLELKAPGKAATLSLRYH